MATPRPTLCATIAASVLALSACPALAQDDDPDPDGDIVVEGTLEVDGVGSRQQARDITQRLGSTSEPLARWQRPICAGTWGLLPENASAVINRIYDNAELAGLVVDPVEDCAANVWVVVVDDPAATFEQLREENAWMVRGLGRAERNRVSEQTGPVRAWNISSYRDYSGRYVPSGWQAAANGGAPTVETYNMSRTRTAVRRDIDMSVVLIDRSVMGELDAYALGDYASMRMLARTEEPSRDTTYATILTIFEDDLAPNRLSAFDRAYLRSLNHGTAYRPGTRGLASFDEIMEEELLREAGQLPDD